MIYFRTYAKSIGCDADSLGDMAVWDYILRQQGKKWREVLSQADQ